MKDNYNHFIPMLITRSTIGYMYFPAVYFGQLHYGRYKTCSHYLRKVGDLHGIVFILDVTVKIVEWLLTQVYAYPCMI